jgi:PAS domain S-box-containing protein
MSNNLNLLILDDNHYDAELEVAVLEKTGYCCTWERVETRDSFLARLKSNTYDIIIADHSLPSFDGISALKLFRNLDLDTPFILVSGTVGEEIAIESLRAGAVDYVLKTRLSRLGPVVKRALSEREIDSQRKLAEEALKESEEKFRVIFEKSLDVIAIIDLETEQFVRVNQSVCDLLGYGVTEIVGRNFSVIFPNESSQLAHKLLQSLTVRDVVFESQEFVRADGSICIMDLTATLIPWGKGEAVLATFRDVSERKRAEEEHHRLEERLIQAQKMESIGRLAGGVAHDFNNLLTAIIGYSQLLLTQIHKDAPFRRELEEIMKAGQRAGALTAQLLAFSRQQELERKVINLNDTVGNLINMLRRIIGEDVEVFVHTGSLLTPVYADPTQIEQVLLNLSVNARDAMPGGGKLIIRTGTVTMDEILCRQNSWARPGKYALIEVVDTGHGMDQETIHHIFDPFFTTKSPGKGTGLGLSVVYGIINQHDGIINVRSTPGHGTTFEIYLPVYEGVSRPDTSALPANVRGGSETILVAEDELALQKLIYTLLSQLGYKVLMASDGEEAIRLYKENRKQIDVILLDLVMPKMGGDEVYSRLHALDNSAPVILMTGYTTEPGQDESREQNGIRLLRKPYSINELAQKIREAMDSALISSRR